MRLNMQKISVKLDHVKVDVEQVSIDQYRSI